MDLTKSTLDEITEGARDIIVTAVKVVRLHPLLQLLKGIKFELQGNLLGLLSRVILLILLPDCQHELNGNRLYRVTCT